MRILIVDGWTEQGNLQHAHAGCATQARVFEDLIREIVPHATTRIFTTNEQSLTSDPDLTGFHAAIWTGGGGNIYTDNIFNKNQLNLCEQVLSDIPLLWGSCWGLQVVVTVLGGLVAKARVPEIGTATNIIVNNTDNAKHTFRGKPAKFDAPAHHGDEVIRLPSGFEILAENNVTLQAVAANDGSIICTQYHPEIPYDYLRRLLVYWKDNYRDTFTELEFQKLLATLETKELAEKDLRKIEFVNWLGSISEN